MSLINDALQRAKQAADAKPPADKQKDLEFRPAPPESQTPQHPRGIGIALSVCLAVIALLGLLLLWQLFLHNGAPQEVRASTLTPEPAASPLASSPDSKAPNKSTVPSGSVASNTLMTVTEAGLALEPPKPQPPKLQGIVFNPSRPSAVINGDTLFVGEKLGDFRIRTITRDSVILVSKSQTNVLTLH